MRITNLSNIRHAVQSMAWVIHEPKLAEILSVLDRRLHEQPLTADEIAARFGSGGNRGPVQTGSVAVIPLAGTLYPKANVVTESSGGCSVEQFISQLEAAVNDPAVTAIVIDTDSPGGAAQGIPEAAARMREMRGRGKPIVAVASGLMASGAYWLASQADSIVGAPSAMIGSIGAFMVHQEASQYYAKEGITNTVVRAGKYKAEANQFEPLTDEAKADLQARVDEAYQAFLSDVAKGRKTSVATVKSDFGEGRVMSSKAALAAGMIDKLGTLQSVVRDLAGPKAKAYVRAADDALPVFADADAVGFPETDLLTAALEVSADTPLELPRAGAALESTHSSHSAPPSAEEHTVDNPTNAAPAAAGPSREQQLTELAALTGNTNQLFTWIQSGKTVAQIQQEIIAARGTPAPVASADIRVGTQRETLKPWANFGEQIKAVINHGMNVGETDPRLYAAASGMNQQVPSEGGFLVAPQFSTAIWDELNNQPDALLPMTDNYTVTGESLTFNANAETSRANGSRYGGVRGYWLNEADALTASQPKFRQVRVEPQEMAVLVYMTEKLMNNSGVALQQYVSRAAADEINFLTSDAIFRGDGVGKPKGFTVSNAKIQVSKETSQAAATVNQYNISKMWARLHPRLRRGAVWLINADVEPALDTLSTVVTNVAGTENVGGYANKVWDAERRTLKGRPVIVSEFCETLGTAGDIVLWAPQAYVTGTRGGGIKEAMSMHVRFLYAEQALRFMFAVDGQTWHDSAITPYKGSNTQSSVITLQTR